MEEEIGKGSAVPDWSWWALASTVQLAWGISSFRRGYAGDSHLMPFRAFAVASLFVGSGATASFAALRASGIHKVEDLILVGANMRSAIGTSPRAREEKADDLRGKTANFTPSDQREEKASRG